VLILGYALIMIGFLIGINCSESSFDNYDQFDLTMNLVAFYSYIVIHAIVICCYIIDLIVLRSIMKKFY